MLLVLGGLGLHLRRRNLAAEKDQIRQLVRIVLARLKEQARKSRDPTGASQSYLIADYLRDEMLQDEHSLAIRQHIWKKVARIVQGNANVRTSLEETEEGEETQVWRWMGAL